MENLSSPYSIGLTGKYNKTDYQFNTLHVLGVRLIQISIIHRYGFVQSFPCGISEHWTLYSRTSRIPIWCFPATACSQVVSKKTLGVNSLARQGRQMVIMCWVYWQPPNKDWLDQNQGDRAYVAS